MQDTITPKVQRPPGFDGSASSGAPALQRVLPTHVIAPEIWTPLPASEPARLLLAAQRFNVQRLRLCLSLHATLECGEHPDLVTLELQANMVADSDPFFMLSGSWYQEQAVLHGGMASSEALAAKAEALSALVNEVSEQRLAADNGKGRLHVVLLSSASAGAPGRLVLLRSHAGSSGMPPQVQIALAMPLSEPAEPAIRAKVHQQIMEMSRISSRLMSGWGIRKTSIEWAAALPGRYQQQLETCVLALGLPRLELDAVRKIGVDKEGELRVLVDRASKLWEDRLVLLRRNFLLWFHPSGASARSPSGVLRLDPESEVTCGFVDSLEPCESFPSGFAFTVVDPSGEQTVLSAADASSRLLWMDALEFNGRVIGAPWRSDQTSFSRYNEATDELVVNPPRSSAAELLDGSTKVGNDRVVTKNLTEETDAAKSGTASSNCRSEDELQTTQGTVETISHDSASLVLVTNGDSSTAQQAAVEADSLENLALNQAIDQKKIEALREMVASKLRRVCTDMMKGASKKPAGPDPSAAALVLGQNFLSRAEEEVSVLRQTVGPDCLMHTDWINYVLGAAYPELEEFLGWVQASYLDNLQDPGLRRLARVANLRTDAFLASLRGHEKPEIGATLSAHLPNPEPTAQNNDGNKTNIGETTNVNSDAVPTHVPMSISTLVSLLRQNKIEDAVSACAQVQGCTTATAACNLLLKLCAKEALGERTATMIFNHLETVGAAPDLTSYSNFIENLCEAKNAARALATLNRMRALGCHPCDENFASVIGVCIALADFSKGIQVVRQAIDSGSMPALELLNALLSTARTTEETTTAFQSISLAGHKPNERSYHQLVEAACVCGDSTLAVRALRQMVKRGMRPTEELVSRAIERCATVNVRHCLKVLEMCAAESLPLPARDSVLYFLQTCCKDKSSQLSASAVQDCLTEMHSVGFKIDPDIKEAFRTLRRLLADSAEQLQAQTRLAAASENSNFNPASSRSALDEYVLRSES